MALKAPLRLISFRFQPYLSFSSCTRARYSAPLDGTIPQAKQKYVPTSGTYPQGFLASGTYVGVKKTNTKAADLAVVASTRDCSAAAVFTKNMFQAAPVVVSRDMLKRRGGAGIRAVVVNSGCANAVTGKGGMVDAQAMGKEVDKCISGETSTSDDSPSRTVVMSTGVIGQRLPIQKILRAIPGAYEALSDTHDAWLATAKAICTTDTFPKLLSREFTLPSSPSTTYRIAGMTKGAGMIHPNMATLLAMVLTDCSVAPEALQSILSYGVDRSFNSISIDGDTSTNDTLTILANGAAGGKTVNLDSPDFPVLKSEITTFLTSLAQLVVRDGEGATKFVTIRVKGAGSYEDAKTIASSISRSPLVKTALYGRDANWGRILCATGYSGVTNLNPSATSVSFIPTDGSPELKLLVNGEPENVDEERASEILQHEDLEILVSLGVGKEEATYWTCDFSHEYVTINGDYRT